jgi:hypothetical protein
MSEELNRAESIEKANTIGVEISNYRIRKGVVLGVTTVNVIGRASALLPFVTVINSEIPKKVEVLIRKNFEARNSKNDGITMNVGGDRAQSGITMNVGGDETKSAADSVSDEEFTLPTDFYELRNANNEIVFITDLRGFQSLYMDDLSTNLYEIPLAQQ